MRRSFCLYSAVYIVIIQGVIGGIPAITSLVVGPKFVGDVFLGSATSSTSGPWKPCNCPSFDGLVTTNILLQPANAAGKIDFFPMRCTSVRSKIAAFGCGCRLSLSNAHDQTLKVDSTTPNSSIGGETATSALSNLIVTSTTNTTTPFSSNNNDSNTICSMFQGLATGGYMVIRDGVFVGATSNNHGFSSTSPPPQSVNGSGDATSENVPLS
jgi:hypothetical protein